MENPVDNKNRKVLWVVFGCLLLWLIASVWYITTIYKFFNPPVNTSGVPGYITFTEEYYNTMHESLDVVQVQDWLNTLSESEIAQLQNQQYQVRYFPKKLPKSVDNLKRRMSYIAIIKDDQYGMCMHMSWGGPIARWGVFVGPREMPIPATVDVSYDENGYRNIGEYRVKLEDGAYVWHEIK